MSYGLGYGQPFGADPLIDTEQPVAEVGGLPVVYDLSDEPDGAPLPGTWEHYVLEHDGAGAIAYTAEPDPATFFRVADGLGLFQYTRSPALPGPSDAFTERGYAASPLGLLEGRDGELRAVVVAPTELQDGTADAFEWRVSLGLRWVRETGAWVGAVMRASWDQANGWTTRLALEIVQAAGGDPVVVAAAPAPELDDLLDIWRTQPQAELAVELRGSTLTATLSGVVELTAQVPGDGPPGAIVLIEATNRRGSFIYPEPMLAGLQVRSLRDLDRLGASPSIPGSVHLEAAGYEDIRLPIRQLESEDLIKRIGGRRFQFTQETTVDAPGRSYRFEQGEVVRILEKLETQPFVRCIQDLQYERGRKKGL